MVLASKRSTAPLAGAALAILFSFPVHAIATGINLISNLDFLPYDENGHLASHVLAYPAIEPCKTLIEDAMPSPGNLHHHVSIGVKGRAASELFGDEKLDAASTATDATQCPAVCLDRGVDRPLAKHQLPENYYDPIGNKDHEGGFTSFATSLSCGRVEFGFINYSPETLSLFWVNEEGVKHYLYPLERTEKNTRFIHTFIGHRFIAEDPETGEELLDHTVEFSGTIGISNHKNQHRKRDIRKEVQRTMGGEWSKHHQVKRTFSSLGFDKGRLPDDVFASMRAFWYNNRDPPHRLMEEWESKGLYVNFWESDCKFIHIKISH